MNENRIVVFGGSGYVGNAVSNHLASKFDVLVADVNPPKSGKRLGFTTCDVRVAQEVTAAVSGASAAIYFAVVQIPAINEQQRLGYEVNILGLQNACEACFATPTVRGLVQSGTWHVFGEHGLNGTIDESFGFRPDNVEDRAKIYSLSKIAQESITRLYDSMSSPTGKLFASVRMGTVLGEGMSDLTAAGIFIKNGLNRAPLTPYSHSMYRPMLFVDILDVCRAYTRYVEAMCKGDSSTASQIPHVVNMVWPEPVTVLDLAEMVRDAIAEETNGRVVPRIEVKETGVKPLFVSEDKDKFKMNVGRALSLAGTTHLTSPTETIRRIVSEKLREKKDKPLRIGQRSL